MLNIEEYILSRKQEDHLKDFDLESRDKNIRTCVNYVFDYFYDYLPQHEKQAKIYMNNEKIEKYRSRLHEFSPDVKNWLINLYSKHNNLVHILLKNIIAKNAYFLLCYSEDDFKSIAIECRSKLTRKYPYLRDEDTGILMFIKDYYRIKSMVYHNDIIPKLPQNIADWINDTMSKYHVELRSFANNWCFKVLFDDTVTKPKIFKNFFGFEEFEKDFFKKENLFGIDELYEEIQTKPFITDRKQELFTIIVYYWTDFFKNPEAWESYLQSYNCKNL